MALSDKAIQNLKPKDKQYKKTDGEGLFILVKPNGSKLWGARLCLNSNYIDLRYGSYKDVSLHNARVKNRENRELIAKGINPKHHQAELEAQAKAKARENECTFEKIARKWNAVEISKKGYHSDHLKDVLHKLEKDIFPKIGHVPVKHLTAPMIIDSLNGIVERDALNMVQKMCSIISSIIEFSIGQGEREHNPAARIKNSFKTRPTKHQPTIKPDELPLLIKTIRESKIEPSTRYLIEFHIHTLLRASEIVQTLWSEIDLEKKLLKIPAARMLKNSTDHTIPLSDAVINILIEMAKVRNGSRYVFPSCRGGIEKHMSAATANAALKRNGYKGKCVAHGIRSIGSTFLHNCGKFDFNWVERCLSHIVGTKVSRAYNRGDYLKQRVKIMNYWSNHVIEATKKSYNI